jgi:hypothetical protein
MLSHKNIKIILKIIYEFYIFKGEGEGEGERSTLIISFMKILVI